MPCLIHLENSEEALVIFAPFLYFELHNTVNNLCKGEPPTVEQIRLVIFLAEAPGAGVVVRRESASVLMRIRN